MKLSTVIASVNNNPAYYLFIPKQIIFWQKFNIKFIAIFVGEKIPDELIAYKANIILWSHNLDINSAYVAQNIRIYYTALLDLPADELVMMTDMDMLPMNHTYFTEGLEQFNVEDFIYYREVACQQIYMCYNAAHPSTWGKVFGINNEEDIKRNLYEKYIMQYDGIPGSTGWFIDQNIMFDKLINYKHLKVLNRPLKRLDVDVYENHLKNRDDNFINKYDDAHFHRSYFKHEASILDAERQIL